MEGRSDAGPLRHRGPGPYILSFDQQKQIQRLRFQAWKEDPENPDKAKTAEQMHEGASHKTTRDPQPTHRAARKDVPGGIEWMNPPTAAGRFDDLIMRCMNEAVPIRKQQLRGRKGKPRARHGRRTRTCRRLA